MKTVSIRLPDETIAFVKHEARKRGLDTEAEMWRIIIERGIANTEGSQAKLEALVKIAVQSLCLVQRLAGSHDESLLEHARQDSKNLLQRMGML